ncbi:MAG: DUF368 domain-containing protein [Pseudomonadales bacterium]|nr:DUF368 domain-containing protein [Pseudomonadales bacterium]
MAEKSQASGNKSVLNLEGLVLFLKGIAMGLGDSMPGVSGGTIAVITNIYERLIFAIRSIDLEALKLLISNQPAKSWQHVDGNFLLIVALGALTGLLISANTVLYLLDSYPEPLMAFFIGLVLASTWILKSEFKLDKFSIWPALIIGAALSVLIGGLEPRVAEVNLVYIFICGAIGICAMILPGLSGAFILLLLGIYQFMLTALVEFEFLYIAVFVAGCLLGLLAFSRVLAWLLKHYHEISFAAITGMLLGSIYVLWPWKQVVSLYTDSAGDQHPLQSSNIWPLNYTEITGNSPWLMLSIVAFIGGVAAVTLLHSLFNKNAAGSV